MTERSYSADIGWTSPTLAHQIEIELGMSLADLQWRVLELARLQLGNLDDLIEPGRTVHVTVSVRT